MPYRSTHDNENPSPSYVADSRLCSRRMHHALHPCTNHWKAGEVQHTSVYFTLGALFVVFLRKSLRVTSASWTAYTQGKRHTSRITRHACHKRICVTPVA